MKVQKPFAGNDNAITIAKENFYIDATGSRLGTKNLTLDNYTDYDAETDTYTWLLEDITYGKFRKKDYSRSHGRI